jgi:hypothetical protein
MAVRGRKVKKINDHANKEVPKYWKDYPILSWVVDDFEQFDKILKESKFDLNNYLKDYQEKSFTKIGKILFQSPFSLNLGGETKKNKLIATDKPIGVFNFSLAAKTLYPLSEFYSQRLADEDPNRFANLNLLSGIVPNLLVDFFSIGDEKKYFYKDEKGVEYPCIKRVKGQTTIDRGIPNAKLEYKSKTKKVYQTYKRKGGKVRYVEIYSLFYYDRLSGDLQYAIRHLPAMMVAEYLESVGVKVRIYMTRFVELHNKVNLRKFELNNGVVLPMFEEAPSDYKNDFENQLLLQPIIAKEFQQEINNPLAYLISSREFSSVYIRMAQNTIKQETTQGDVSVFGTPNFDEQEMYWEGFERYKNKYQKYVELGIFKSKEVLAESMILFHDMAINVLLSGFIYDTKRHFERLNNTYYEQEEAILIPEVNSFFTWWMKTSANIIKHKVNLINSNELNKDLRDIRTDVESSLAELNNIINTIQDQDLKNIYVSLKSDILSTYKIFMVQLPNGSEVFDLNAYVGQLVTELTVTADDVFFPTPDDVAENKTEFSKTILAELKKV